jgi:hypothetical protein
MSQDPYAPPKSTVADVGFPQQGKRSRPVLVWLITFFFGLSTVWTLLSLLLVATNAIPTSAIPLPPATREYFDRLTVLDHGFSVGLSALNLYGLALLFLMRANAIRVFLAALAASPLMTGYHLVVKGLASAVDGPAGVGMLLGWLLWCGVLLYAYRLNARGILR